MIPCYQICKDQNCSHWNEGMLDCDHLPDDCEFAIEHLVSDCENQKLDGKEHGFWTEYDKKGNLISKGGYIESEKYGLWMIWYANGFLAAELNYLRGELDGACSWWYENGGIFKEAKYDCEVCVSDKRFFINGEEWHDIF